MNNKGKSVYVKSLVKSYSLELSFTSCQFHAETSSEWPEFLNLRNQSSRSFGLKSRF